MNDYKDDDERKLMYKCKNRNPQLDTFCVPSEGLLQGWGADAFTQNQTLHREASTQSSSSTWGLLHTEALYTKEP